MMDDLAEPHAALKKKGGIPVKKSTLKIELIL